VFGNAGALFMNAMTWWDHETNSVWSQPWGRAIQGDYKGVELFLLPSQITTWASWKKEYPHSLVMTNDLELLGSRRERFNENFVIGLLIDGNAKAFPFIEARDQGVINDSLGSIPILLWVGENSFHAYLRLVEGKTLTFRSENGLLIDNETQSTWNETLGLAIKGPLQGKILQGIPSSSAYNWAWFDFFPESEIYSP